MIDLEKEDSTPMTVETPTRASREGWSYVPDSLDRKMSRPWRKPINIRLFKA
jgi:hypothetical protein